MDTLSPRTASSCSTYTSGFLNQLQSEWNEFILEITRSTPQNKTDSETSKSIHSCSAKAAFIESLNKFNRSSEGNIFIPVPLNTLKKFFSPSIHDTDIFKNDFFKEIEENLNLTKLSCKKLRYLLSIDESHEISDFPSPSLPTRIRSSAPPNLFPKKKLKSAKSAIIFKTYERNDTPRIDQIDKNLSRECRKLFDRPKSLISAKVVAGNCVETRNPRVSQENTNLRDENIRSPGKKIESVDSERKLADHRGTILIENGLKNGQINYTGSDSSSLFYTLERPIKLPRPTIVCTYFDQKELCEIYRMIKRLGFFEVENHVSSRTTHLVCGGSNKTVNLCKAIARGCWILDKEWITGSNEANRWLLEERFEKKSLSPAVQVRPIPSRPIPFSHHEQTSKLENRMRRQRCGSTYRCQVFIDCDSLYVSPECSQPSARELKELILLGGGRLEESPERASRVVGYSSKRRYVKEIWILNCVLRGYIVDATKYVRNKSKS